MMKRQVLEKYLKWPGMIPAIDRRMDTPSWIKPALAVVVALGALLRLLYFFDVQNNPMSVMTSRDSVFDQFQFVTLAQDILAHHGLGSKLILQSPGYSYVIAALFKVFGPQLNAIFLFQILVGLMAIYLLYRSASLLFENKHVGLLAALLAACYGPFIFFECTVLRDLLIGYTHLAGFYFLVRALKCGRVRYFFLAGLTLGLALVLRPTVIVLLLPASFFLLPGSFRSRAVWVAVMAAGLLTALCPLVIRNSMVGGKNVLIESSEPGTFWTGNSPDSVGFGGTPYSPTQKTLIAEAQGKVGPILSVWFREVRLHPREYRQLYARKFKMLFNGVELPDNLSYDLYKENSRWLPWYVVDFSVVCPLAFLGMLLAAGKYRQARVLYWAFFLMAGFIFSFHIQARYRLSLVPFLILFAAYALYWFGYQAQQKKYKVLVPAVAAGIVFAMFTRPADTLIARYFGARVRSVDYGNMAGAYLYVLGKRIPPFSSMDKEELLHKALDNYRKAGMVSRLEEVPKWIFNMGLVYLELREYAAAEEFFKKALEINPAYTKALNNLSMLYSQTGRYDEAVELTQKSVGDKGTNIKAFNNMAVAYVRMGKNREAVETCLKILAVDPDNDKAHNTLGVAYLNSGEFDEALSVYKKLVQIAPNYPEALNNMGLVYRAMHRISESAFCFEKAIELRPTYINALSNLADAYAELGREEDAAEVRQKARALAK